VAAGSGCRLLPSMHSMALATPASQYMAALRKFCIPPFQERCADWFSDCHGGGDWQ
jgi:hypothetical protein